MEIKTDKLAAYQLNKTGELNCAICGGLLHIIRFKNGYICDSCLQYVKTFL